MMICHWHGKRAYQTGGVQGRADLRAAGVTHIGVDWQDQSPYVNEMVADGYRVARTVGELERPTARDFSAPCDALAWDLEGGGDPAENAHWFRALFARAQARIPSCQLPIVYSGLPSISAARYGCDFGLLHREFRRWWGWPRPLPVCAVGGVRGPLPANALQGMPDSLPVLFGVTPPDYTTSPDTWEQQVRVCVQDRLAWVKRRNGGKTDGLCLVKAVDGPAGARWGEWDTRICRIVGEELAA